MSLGGLEAEVLGLVRRRSRATGREILVELEPHRHVGYTTIGTVLDRLHRKGWLAREKRRCQGGWQYVYRVRSRGDRLVHELLDGAVRRLVVAFGPEVIPAFHAHLRDLTSDSVAQEAS